MKEEIEKEIMKKEMEIKRWNEFMKKQNKEIQQLYKDKNEILIENEALQEKYKYIINEMNLLQNKYIHSKKQQHKEIKKHLCWFENEMQMQWKHEKKRNAKSILFLFQFTN